LGSPLDALALLKSSLGLFQQMNDQYEIAHCQRCLSYVYHNLRDFERQREVACLALEGFRNAGYHHEIGESTFAVLFADHAAGNFEEAAAASREALSLCLVDNNIPVALRCIFAIGLMRFAGTRQLGLALMCFAADHPAMRKRDIKYIEAQFRSLGLVRSELAAARQQAARWTVKSVGDMLLHQFGWTDGFCHNLSLEAEHCGPTKGGHAGQ
jgi:hypothetical protein